MKRKQTLLALSLGFTLGTCHADDLMTVYQQALDNDATYRAAEQAYHAAEQNSPIARSALLPHVNLAAGVSRNSLDTQGVHFLNFEAPDDTYNFDQKNYNLTLTQPLFNYASWAGRKQADQAVAQAGAAFEAEGQGLILRVANAYFKVLTARDQLQFSRTREKASQRLMEQAKQRFDAGLSTLPDVKQAEASFDLARAQTLQSTNALDNTRENLAVITGQTPGILNPLAPAMTTAKPKPDSVDPWIESALKHNPLLAAARFASEAASEGVAKARGSRYPVINLVAGRDFSDADGGLQYGKQTNDAIGLQLNVPLFSGFGTSARIEQSLAQSNQAEEQLKGVERTTRRDTRSAFLDVNSAIAQVNALKQAVASNQAALDAAEEGFKSGLRTSLDVLNSISELYNAKSEYAQARYNYLLSSLKLKQSAGTLNKADLAQINAHLEHAAAAGKSSQ